MVQVQNYPEVEQVPTNTKESLYIHSQNNKYYFHTAIHYSKGFAAKYCILIQTHELYNAFIFVILKNNLFLKMGFCQDRNIKVNENFPQSFYMTETQPWLQHCGYLFQ